MIARKEMAKEWSDICKMYDLEDDDGDVLPLDKAMRLSISEKLDIMERDGPDSDGTFECFMWNERKMEGLLRIVIRSSSIEEILSESHRIFSMMSTYNCLFLSMLPDDERVKAAFTEFELMESAHYQSVEDELNDGP